MALERITDKRVIELVVDYCKKPAKEQDVADLVITGAQTQLEADQAQNKKDVRAAMERVFEGVEKIRWEAASIKDCRLIKEADYQALKSELLGK